MTDRENNQDVKGEWHQIDAQGKVLGRLATEAASLLLGKHRVDSRANQVAMVYVVVINTDKVVLTGKKEQQKIYYRHSGYPGGLKERTAAEQRQRDSRKMVRDAVSGMLPKNKLRDRRLAHLKLYTGEEHLHAAQMGTQEVNDKVYE